MESLSKFELKNGVKACSFGSSQYVRASVEDAERYLKETIIKLPGKVETPIQA